MDANRLSEFRYLLDYDQINKLTFPNSQEPNQPHKYDFDSSKFKFVDIIASKGSTIVKYFIFKPLDVHFVVKILNIPTNQDRELNQEDVEEVLKEIKIFKLISHCPDIVDFYGFCFDIEEALNGNKQLLICMELMDASLEDIYLFVHKYSKTNPRFSEKLVGLIAANILNALIYIKREFRLMHRDIKPHNILLNDKGAVKLCDFGISKILEGGMTIQRDENRF